jgi:hypothetical protein
MSISSKRTVVTRPTMEDAVVAAVIVVVVALVDEETVAAVVTITAKEQGVATVVATPSLCLRSPRNR